MADPGGFRVLIADDERPARSKLRRFLEQESGIATIYEAWDGETTLMVLRDAEPDIAFLDIQMPGRTGLEVLASLPAERLPHVVFVTAYDEHAVRAFDIGAVDYLLKPFDRERFGRAFRRARDAASDKSATQDLHRLVALLRDSGIDSVTPAERLLVDAGDKRVLIPANRVDRLEAERNYVRIHAGGAVHRVRGTLGEFESRLDPRRFARVGRGTIVNLDRVSHLEPAGRGDYLMILADGSRVRLSRRYASRVEQRLGA
jgi:two-component system LytT family response regulator